MTERRQYHKKLSTMQRWQLAYQIHFNICSPRMSRHMISAQSSASLYSKISGTGPSPKPNPNPTPNTNPNPNPNPKPKLNQPKLAECINVS